MPVALPGAYSHLGRQSSHVCGSLCPAPHPHYLTRELLPLKLLRLGARGREAPVVRTDDGRCLDASPITRDFDGAFLASGGLDRLRAGLAADALAEIDADGLRVGAPVARPGKVVCIGLNYLDHAAETGAAIPSRPVVFMKDPGTVVGPYDDVLIPRGSTRTDWEVELAVVIGRMGTLPDRPRGGRRGHRLATRSATTSPNASSSSTSRPSGISASPARPSTRSARGWSPPTRSRTRRASGCT